MAWVIVLSESFGPEALDDTEGMTFEQAEWSITSFVESFGYVGDEVWTLVEV